MSLLIIQGWDTYLPSPDWGSYPLINSSGPVGENPLMESFMPPEAAEVQEPAEPAEPAEVEAGNNTYYYYDTTDDITYQVTREDHDESYYITSINDTATDEADQDNHEGTHFC